MGPRQLDQQVDPALVLEVAERFNRFSLNVQIGIVAGNRGECLGRCRLRT